MNIALDCMGGDFGPPNTVEGARMALDTLANIDKLYLVGDESAVKAKADALRLPSAKIEIVPSTEIIEMTDPATAPLRAKKNSSITIATKLVKDGTCQAVVSPGHTGASVAAATVLLRNLKGIDRAGIASPIPNEYGICNLIDAGANPEAKPEHVFQYGVMGSVYAQHVLGKKNPVVGLMSVGEEDEKGTEFTKEVFAMLKASNLNFRGNVEGHDLYETELDVVVCDGFVGNVVLKSCEATAKIIFKWVRTEIKRSHPLRKLGALMAKGAFKNVKEKGNYESYGGSPLLGVNGVCIIGHGSSSALAIKNAIRVASEAVSHHVNPHIEEEIAAHSSIEHHG